jgi:hypothetical protein
MNWTGRLQESHDTTSVNRLEEKQSCTLQIQTCAKDYYQAFFWVLIDLIVDSVSHFVYEFVEFVIVLGHGQSPILSNKPLDKLDVTARLLL